MAEERMDKDKTGGRRTATISQTTKEMAKARTAKGRMAEKLEPPRNRRARKTKKTTTRTMISMAGRTIWQTLMWMTTSTEKGNMERRMPSTSNLSR